jgi:hypothetical protein
MCVCIQLFCSRKRRYLGQWYSNFFSRSAVCIFSSRFYLQICFCIKNGVFWDVRRAALLRTDISEGRSASIIRRTIISVLGTLAATSYRRRLLVTAKIVPSSRILVTLMMEAQRSFETWILKRATRPNIQEHAILHGHSLQNLKSYIVSV